MKVLVTGASGFIGKNLCAQLEQDKGIQILRFGKDNTDDELKDYVGKSDFVFHLAGVNRPKEVTEFDKGNRELTEHLLALIAQTGRKIPVLLASSAQATLDNPYGKSKEAAEKAALKWSQSTDSPVYIYRLPGVFGKWCKPNYNSVVATFCHNIANGLDITISDPAATVTLVYIDEVIAEFIKSCKGNAGTSSDGIYKIPRGFTVTLKEIADKLEVFHNIHESLLVPNLEGAFDRFLYATYISYLDKEDFAYTLDTKEDERGNLAEIIKSQQSGQILVSRTKPGFSRGNHWHHTKIEKFLVIDGEAEVCLRNLYSSEVITYKVSGEKLKVVDIPTGYVHSIKNTGKNDLLTLIWADEIFDPQQPDTYYLEV